MSNSVLILKNIRRTFHTQGHPRKEALEILRGIDLTVHAGETIALVGPSGAGKSTLLHIAGLLEKPDTGTVSIMGHVGNTLNDDKRTRLRRDYMGFVYQYHHLLAEFTALENIVMPMLIRNHRKAEAVSRAEQLLDMMRLGPRKHHRPARLSGGEQQRVAIARALANGPRILIADEPTGNLDPDTSDAVFTLLHTITKEAGLAALIATHNMELANRLDKIVRIEHGVLETLSAPDPTPEPYMLPFGEHD